MCFSQFPNFQWEKNLVFVDLKTFALLEDEKIKSGVILQ